MDEAEKIMNTIKKNDIKNCPISYKEQISYKDIGYV